MTKHSVGDDAALVEVLFAPLTINELTLTNRIVMSPMATLGAHADGRPSEQTIAFLGERAKGGVGLIIMGCGIPTRRAAEEVTFKGVVRFDDDRFVPDLRRLTDAVHAHGTPIFAQLIAGFGAMGKHSRNRPLMAASPKNVVMKAEDYPEGIIVPFDRKTKLPRQATVDELRQLEVDTAEAAVRAQRAGFDGVEIGAHMSYFLASFLSPRSNWRNDEYGGNLENRARILVNIVRLVRQRVGPSFPIGLRICANEHVDGGQGPQEYAAIAALVEREGVDYLALTDGTYESIYIGAAPKDAPTIEHGEAQVFRQAVTCPLIVSSIHDPRRAAEVIAAGQADAVMYARSLLADPAYANKIRDGRSDDIVSCDRQNYCFRRQGMGMPIRCTVNPRMGRESRRPGQRPPIDRLIKAPIEQAVLAATGSERLMGLAGRIARKMARSNRAHQV